MSLEQEDDHEPLTACALQRQMCERAIYQAIQEQDDQGRRAAQWSLIQTIALPDEWRDHLIELYLTARRIDEGVRRVPKPGQQATEIALMNANQPLLAVIRAAFRAGMYEALYPGDKPS